MQKNSLFLWILISFITYRLKLKIVTSYILILNEMLKSTQIFVEIYLLKMTKRKASQNKKIKKTKKITHLFNKVFDDFKKKQKINEKKEIRLREEIVKKEQIKIRSKEKELKFKEEELKKKRNKLKKKMKI
tara:strand:- start:294 stop:686 length:393 start_codon:yes stop_codon:yes gene_type:complete